MDMLNSFDKEFITDLFLDTDSVSTMNRLVVAVANVINENNENVHMFNETSKKECLQVMQNMDNPRSSLHALKHNSYDEDYDLLHNEQIDSLPRFKMKKSTVRTLVNFLKEQDVPGTNISLEKRVHVFLRLLTCDSSYSEVGTLFGLKKSTVSSIFHEMAMMLSQQRFHFIRWPSRENQHITRIKVNSRYKFPNCVGFIDACRFNIRSKRKRKDNLETILLQAVCDESLLFIDVHVGDIGDTKKGKLFKTSSLAREIRNFVNFENHLLGDSEYKLKKCLITPFTSEEVVTGEEMKFNEIHWKARSYIGNAFELLKERFKKLNHIETTSPEMINALIYSACVLHNFIILHEGYSGIKEEVVVYDDAVAIDKAIVKTAVEKRQFLCNYINYLEDTSYDPAEM